MEFATRPTNVIELKPVDDEAEELASLEEQLAELFPSQRTYVLQHTKDHVSLQWKYDAAGLKLVYKYLVDTSRPNHRTAEQQKALKKAAKFIRKFDQSWVAPT